MLLPLEAAKEAVRSRKMAGVIVFMLRSKVRKKVAEQKD